MKITIVQEQDIQDIITEAKKEGLIFSKSTTYYRVYSGDQIVGITGIVWKKPTVIFKNHYIFPEFRRKGMFRDALDIAIVMTKMWGGKAIEATCTPLSINEYTRRGAVVLHQFKNGCKKVRLTL